MGGRRCSAGTSCGPRVCAIGARLQQITKPGDRVAILAPQGLDYVAAFFGAVHAGNIAVPLVRAGLSGHAERLAAVLADARPAAVLTTTAAAESVRTFIRTLAPNERPRMIAVDAVPDNARFDVHRRGDRHRRHRLPAVHLWLDAIAGRGGDHPPIRLHQRDADGHDRWAGRRRPQRELAAAVSRYGPDDDHVPGVLRGAPHTDGSDGISSPALPMDQAVGHRVG